MNPFMSTLSGLLVGGHCQAALFISLASCYLLKLVCQVLDQASAQLAADKDNTH